MEELRGLAVGAQKPLPLAAAALVVGVVLHLGQGHVELVGQEAHGLGKVQPLHVHDELDHAAPGLAAEAVVKLLLGIHGEGGGFFAVKRAQTPISMPVPLQRYIAGNNLYNVGALAELVQPGGGIARRHGKNLTPLSLSPVLMFRHNSRISFFPGMEKSRNPVS